MALSAEIIKLLNDFADSQPALRLPGLPLGQSNPKLGDALNAQISAAETAAGTPYTATTPANWSPAPTNAGTALDQLAARVSTAQADATQGIGDAATAQSTAEDAQNQLYSPAVGANWVDADPVTLKEAVDRLAAAVQGLLSAPIP